MKGRTVQLTAQKRWEINIMKGTSIFSRLLAFSVFHFRAVMPGVYTTVGSLLE